MRKNTILLFAKEHKVLALSLFVGTAITLTLVGFIGTYLFVDVPSIEGLSEREIIESTKIYDRTGEHLLWEIHGEERRTVVPFHEITRHVKNATIAIEDSSFYSHPGIDVRGIMRAFFVDVLSGEFSQGGSTITQQLVKRTILDPRRTLVRKIREAIIAIKVEQIYSKDEILNLYLNDIPYGSNAYGIEAAAQTYFGKSSSELTVAESAYMAALPQAPSYYSPYGNHKEDLDARKNKVLEQMHELGFITSEAYEEAKAATVNFRPPESRGIRAPHFIMYVRDLISEEYGEEYIERAGLRITSTIDIDLQTKAEELVKKYAEINEKQFRASNAGIVAVAPENGHILTMVGSRDFFDIEREGNFNITLAHRQPGSAFKPIVYATAFEKGYTPETVLFDLSTEFASRGATSYRPGNYDDAFRGPMSLRNALAQSINIPAVKLLYLVGIPDALTQARKMGITSLSDPSRFGLSLVLGGGEVSPLELTSAYSVFAADGNRVPHTAIIKIETPDGSVLYEHEPKPERVLSEYSARAISSILSDNAARTPAFGVSSPLYFPNIDVAVKTGTTNDYRDAWTVGYSTGITVGAWAGNNDNATMEKKVAGFIITPLWREFMNYALTKVTNNPFPEYVPNNQDTKPILRGNWMGSRTYTIDKISGKQATEHTPPELREERVITEVHEILHWVIKSDPRGPIPVSPQNDPQYANWESPVRAWAAERQIVDQNDQIIPSGFDDIHKPEFAPKISIEHPSGNHTQSEILQIRTRIESPRPIKQVDIFINEEYTRSEQGNPSSISLTLSDSHITEGKNMITFRAYDDVGNRGETTFTIEIAPQ